MWVRFTADYDHREPGFTVAYKAGWTGNIPTAHAETALAAGKAVRMRKASKDAEPVDADEQSP
jgi:hypothetical protein